MTPKKVRKEWVKWLRSGDFKQGKGQLMQEDSEGVEHHCCLGVLCELAIKHGIIKQYDSCNGSIPDSVQEWVGLKDSVGEYANGSLADRNDRGWSFKKIARLIETSKTLFEE